jgi:hypothetical protein
MSITTLKKKHSAMYNISGGNGFSLNNSRRFEVQTKGQTQPPMRGTGYHGYGKGNYDNVPTKSNYVCYDEMNKGSVSVKNTRGRIATSFKWVNRPFPFATTQDLTTPDYATTYALKNAAKTKAEFCNGVPDKSGACVNNTNIPQSLHRKSKTACYQVSTFVNKPQTDYATYYRTEFLNKNNIPVPPTLKPFPPPISNSKHCCAALSRPSYTDFIQNLQCR